MSDTEVCAVNIGPKQRRMREISGYIGLALGVGLAVGLIVAGVDWRWRTTVFLPVFGGLLGLLQARGKT